MSILKDRLQDTIHDREYSALQNRTTPLTCLGVWWIAGHGSHIGGNRDLKNLKLFREAEFLMTQATRNHYGIARHEANLAAVFEFEIDPAIQQVNKLHIALVVMPSRRL